MQDNELEADGFTTNWHDGGQLVRIGFTSGSREAAVILPTANLPQLIASLTEGMSHGNLAPIRPHQLQAGDIIHPLATNVRRCPEGVRVVHHFQVDGGGRSFPVTLSTEEARSLIDDLTAALG